MSVADLRRNYCLGSLDGADVDPDPIRQFARWFEEAVRAEVTEPNAMTVATVTPEGRPRARVLLLKGFDARGFTFFTNYESAKGCELAANPTAALCFWWVELERQVRIEGTVTRLDRAESAAYFMSRPLGSRIGAWASQQSHVIADRTTLEARFAELEARYADGDVPMPDYWGGYRLAPDRIEFWQGRPSRLHDRIRYRLEQGSWVIERLEP
ncbi:pyridoxamine 5'-phosphate oxidase [Plasticicumulans lactativorans]|uniref:pyridoxamine 5'-phosphate oxidase n=1 Tax=Plasticicumulans lactativorans TaxID=1133106 RepID=UPI00104A397B|nr:pyridoxamine 5'-phosphate oxidase [Plasticicumulans lactativorans]